MVRRVKSRSSHKQNGGVLRFRVPEVLKEEVATAANARKASVSDICRYALEKYAREFKISSGSAVKELIAHIRHSHNQHAWIIESSFLDLQRSDKACNAAINQNLQEDDIGWVISDDNRYIGADISKISHQEWVMLCQDVRSEYHTATVSLLCKIIHRYPDIVDEAKAIDPSAVTYFTREKR